MKNTLAENMLRFGVKNLQETEIEKLKEQAIQAQSKKEYSEVASFDRMIERGEIKIGATMPGGFNVVESKSHNVFFREPVLLWDGQIGLVYAKRWRTQYSDAIPDPNTPAGKKWAADFEAKINSSAPVITVIKMVGNEVRPYLTEEVKPFEYTVMKFCAMNMAPKGFENGAGDSFVALTRGGIKPNVTPETYNKSRLINDINAGIFGPNAKGKVEALASGFKIV